jgi:hypothetical protein
MKKVMVMSDTHCGHLLGLTPPDFRYGKDTKRIQQECWDWFVEESQKRGPYDLIVLNGDAIDGDGRKSGGTEQITTDRQVQAEMAAECIKANMSKGTKVVLTYGTGYHTGNSEDFENDISKHIPILKIGSHEWVDVEGTIFDFKHHAGSSTIPHGRHTYVAKERIWNVMWNERKNCPKADVIIRSHVHYFDYCGDQFFLGMTTPALQGLGSKYGARRCSGTVDYGFVVFNVNKEGYTWNPVLADIKAQQSTVVKL